MSKLGVVEDTLFVPMLGRIYAADGTVAEEGSPKDLEEKNGVYAHMVKLQTESQNWKLA